MQQTGLWPEGGSIWGVHVAELTAWWGRAEGWVVGYGRV